VPRRKQPPAPPPLGQLVLALDVSSVCVGWALFDGPVPVQYGKFRVPGKDHGERLAHYFEWLLATVAQLGPDDLIVEAPYPGGSYGVLMQYYGVTLQCYWRWKQAEMPQANRVAAAQIKRLLKMPKGSDHDARKQMMVEAVNRWYGLALQYKRNDKSKAVSDDDIADAFAVMRAWRLRHGDLT